MKAGSEWLLNLCGELQLLLEAQRVERCIEGTRKSRMHLTDDLALQIDRLQARRAALAAQLCDVVYLAQRIGASAEFDSVWLRARVRSLLSSREHLDDEAARLSAAISATP